MHRNRLQYRVDEFTPEIICAEIRKRLPDFKMDYDVDPVKKEIAESLPNSLDDTCAREEWGWKTRMGSLAHDGRYAGAYPCQSRLEVNPGG